MDTTRLGRPPRFVFLCDGQPGAQPPGRFGWRLVAANHRPLGRGRMATDSLDQCRADAQRLHRAVDELQTVVVTQDGMWSWQASLADGPVAVCVHPYQRRIECVRGLSQFLAAARTTDPARGVVRHFGPHSLRGCLIELRPNDIRA